jgi:hypothetical protein
VHTQAMWHSCNKPLCVWSWEAPLGGRRGGCPGVAGSKVLQEDDVLCAQLMDQADYYMAQCMACFAGTCACHPQQCGGPLPQYQEARLLALLCA